MMHPRHRLLVQILLLAHDLAHFRGTGGGTGRRMAQAALLSNVLAEPPAERNPNAVKDLQEELARLRKDRQGARREIQRRFPEYASLIRPAPTTVDDIRASLRADEALLSFYFGSRESFVWAIPKDGPIAFAQLALNATQLQSKVTALRAALDPPFWSRSPTSPTSTWRVHMDCTSS